MDLRKRIKNPVFWFSIVALFFSATGIEPETMTSWAKLYDAWRAFCDNPFQLGTFFIALVGIINNPTTPGIKD